jgi:8-oxo-dGTP diphosphatase
MPAAPVLLARGPWSADEIEVRWSDEHFAAPPERVAAADAAIAALRDRGSPSHDGLAARLVQHAQDRDGRLCLRLQPMRWALRLVEGDASGAVAALCLTRDSDGRWLAGRRAQWLASWPGRWALRLVEGDASGAVAALCLTRDSDGRWLAGRRAQWLASWPGRWALGAGGAVDLGENPVHTLTRELLEEWSVAPERLVGELLLRLPHDVVMFVGSAWLPAGAQVTPDHEHDAFAWWPTDVEDWPPEADAELRDMARLVAAR